MHTVGLGNAPELMHSQTEIHKGNQTPGCTPSEITTIHLQRLKMVLPTAFQLFEKQSKPMGRDASTAKLNFIPPLLVSSSRVEKLVSN